MADSHNDKDAAIINSLTKRMHQMTAAGTNQITVGSPSESAIWEFEREGWLLRKMPDDPDCLRISIGEPFTSDKRGRYVVIRGSLDHAQRVLEEALAVVRSIPRSLE